MIKPVELESADGNDIWDTLVAASAGDVVTLRRLLERNPRLSRAGYWYTPAVHFAVREGHADAVPRRNDAAMVEFLLARRAPTRLPDDEPWATPLAWASRRGHTQIVDLLRSAGATR